MKRTSSAAAPAALRHRALADPARIAILEELRGSNEPVDARLLSARLGSHVNTIRWHLSILIDAGLVVSERAGSGARGRPRHLYRVVEEPADADLRRRGILTDALIDALKRSRTDTTSALVEAGRAQARTLAAPTTHSSQPTDGLAEVVGLLNQLGFAPRLVNKRTGAEIRMRPCPFGDAAGLHSSIICPVHLGLIRGTLEAVDAQVEATALEPFARPDLCIAHFRRIPGH